MGEHASALALVRLTDADRPAATAEQQAALEWLDAVIQHCARRAGGAVAQQLNGTWTILCQAADDALELAGALQERLRGEAADSGPLRVAIAVHSAELTLRHGRPAGRPCKIAHRLVRAAHGGQTLLSLAAAAALSPAGRARIDEIGAYDLLLGDGTQPIFQLRGADSFAPPRLDHLVASQLPAGRGPLFGRQEERERLLALLRQPGARLITLSGPGGVGKTRLAQEVAGLIRDEFLDDVFWVRLTPVRDPGLVGAAIAETLGLGDSGDPQAALTGWLADKQLLLVLDNLEHLLEAAPLLAALLAAAPGLRLLVVSRAVLRLSREQELTLAPLPSISPAAATSLADLADAPAAALFLAALRAGPQRQPPADSDAPAIAAICQVLDGLPLALELAAARAREFTLPELLRRLDPPLALLSEPGGSPGAGRPRRHQTLRDTLGWSYDLLTPAEQRFFASLAVFAGGASLEAVEEVCAGDDPSLDALDGLAALCDKSLLLHQPDQHGEPRFAMLETIREYALEQLQAAGEEAGLRRRHAACYARLLEQLEPHLAAPDHARWAPLIDQEQPNLREALAWAAEREPELAGRISGSLWRFWYMHGSISEGRRWLDAAARQRELMSTPTRAGVLLGAGTMAWRQGDYARAAELIAASLELWRRLGQPHALATALNNLGLVSREQGRYDQAQACFEESLALRRSLGDRRGQALVLSNLGTVLAYQGQNQPAVAMVEEGLGLFQQLGDEWGVAVASLDLGKIILADQQLERARELFATNLRLARKGGDLIHTAHALCRLGEVACRQRDFAAALPLLTESLTLRYEIGDQEGVAAALEALGRWQLGGGAPATAATLCAAAEAMRAALGAPRTPIDELGHRALLAELRTLLAPEEWERACADGGRLSPQQAVAQALRWCAPAAPA